MKPWDDKAAIAHLKKIKGSRKVIIGFELTELGLKLLKKRLRAKGLKGKKLTEELEKIIWAD